MCGPTLVPLQKFQGYLSDAVSSRLKDKFEILRKSPAGKMLCLVQDPAKTSLLSLMQNTCHLRCVDPRDKAYAVLNIAKIEKQVIEADYTITVTVLLTRILKSMHDSSMPTSLHRVAKQCMELERLFEEPPNSIFETESREAFSRDINPLRELAATLRPDFTADFRLQQRLGAWCDFYSHASVHRLVFPPAFTGRNGSENDRYLFGATVLRSLDEVDYYYRPPIPVQPSKRHRWS
jgi:hypothetical protein